MMFSARTLGAISLMGSLLAAGAVRAQLSDAQKADIGFTALQWKLGAAMPTGAGISVSQVEAPVGGNYRPDSTLFPGKTFAFPSAGSTVASGHANTVGAFFYGSGSLAPGIGATADGARITIYEANHWLQSGSLRTGTSNALPAVEANDIQNHSWIGAFESADANADAVQRLDYAIGRDDFVAVFALNNGSGTAIPALLASSYNGIAVGLSSGAHSRGTTTINGAGRTKPDIVVPASATSWATPTVSSAAALLLEEARTTPTLGNAQTSVAVKALLLAGATKVEAEFGRDWTHSDTQPLDAVFGAGELNVENSHDILVAGQRSASAVTLAAGTGWDVGTTTASAVNYYFFDLSSAAEADSFTAVLTWNVVVTATDTNPGPGVNYSFSSLVPNLDLRFYQATGFVLGALLESSVGTVDNVELVTRTGLAAGRYALAVSANTTGTAYGLAWITSVPEPAAAGWAVGAGLLVIVAWRRKAGCRRES